MPEKFAFARIFRFCNKQVSFLFLLFLLLLLFLFEEQISSLRVYKIHRKTMGFLYKWKQDNSWRRKNVLWICLKIPSFFLLYHSFYFFFFSFLNKNISIIELLARNFYFKPFFIRLLLFANRWISLVNSFLFIHTLLFPIEFEPAGNFSNKTLEKTNRNIRQLEENLCIFQQGDDIKLKDISEAWKYVPFDLLRSDESQIFPRWD